MVHFMMVGDIATNGSNRAVAKISTMWIPNKKQTVSFIKN